MSEMIVTQESEVTQEVVEYLRQVRYIATRQASRRYPAECRVIFRDGTGDWVDVPYQFGQLLLTTAVNAMGRVGYVDWPARSSDERYANWNVSKVYEHRVASAIPVQMEYMVTMSRFDFAVWEARLCPRCRRPLIWCTCDYCELTEQDVARAFGRTLDAMYRQFPSLARFSAAADVVEAGYDEMVLADCDASIDDASIHGQGA